MTHYHTLSNEEIITRFETTDDPLIANLIQRIGALTKEKHAIVKHLTQITENDNEHFSPVSNDTRSTSSY